MINNRYKKEYKKLHRMDEIRVLCKESVFSQKENTTKFPKYGSVVSIVFAILIFTFSMSSVFASGTVSYFSDVEVSLGNLLHAGSLDFTVALADPSSSNIKLTAGSASVTVVPTVVPGVGDFPLAYKVSVQKVGGTSDALCNAIDLVASSSPFVYNGKLINFSEGTTTLVAPLSLSLSLPANAGFTIADSCFVDIVYSGWVDGQTEGIQYHDTERVSLIIYDPPAPKKETASVLLDTSESTTTPVVDSTSTPIVDSVPTPEATSSELESPSVGTTSDTVTVPEVPTDAIQPADPIAPPVLTTETTVPTPDVPVVDTVTAVSDVPATQ